MADPNQNLFDRLILAFTVLLGIAKADPDDKLEIKRLKLELDQKTTELGAIRAHAPTPEQEDRFVEILGEFIKAVTPEAEPVTDTGANKEPGIRVGTSIFDARDFFNGERAAGEKIRLIHDGREADVATLGEALAFFDSFSVPPVTTPPPAPALDAPGIATPDAPPVPVAEAAPPPVDTPPVEPPVAANNQPPPAE